GLVNLHDLDLEYDFTRLPIVRADDPVSQSDFVRSVPDHDGVQLLVHVDALAFQHRAQQIHEVLRLAVGDIEGADQEILVLIYLLLALGNDQNGIGADPSHEQILRGENQIERFLKGAIFEKDRHRIIPEVLVKHEVNAAGARQNLKHFLRPGVLEFQRDRLSRRIGKDHIPSGALAFGDLYQPILCRFKIR